MLLNNIGIRKQKGFTLMGWFIVLAIFGFFAYLAMILFPVMISNHTMGTVLESLKEEPGITQKSKREVIKLIFNRLLINDIKDVKAGDFVIEKDGPSKMMIHLKYENRIKFANNVFIVIVNEKEVELVRN